MAIKIIDGSILEDIASSIREVRGLGENIRMSPNEMMDYISNPPVKTYKTIDNNGDITDCFPRNIGYLNVYVNETDNTSMYEAYSSNVIGQLEQVCYPVVSDKIINLSFAFYNQRNGLRGKPACGNNVVNMLQSYKYCYNLTGSPVCGPNVVDMLEAYRGCTNLTGDPACGFRVVNMRSAYRDCSNLNGRLIIGPNVTDIERSFQGCYKLTDLYLYGKELIYADNAYRGCYGTKNIFIDVNDLNYDVDVYNTFCDIPFENGINILYNGGSALNYFNIVTNFNKLAPGYHLVSMAEPFNKKIHVRKYDNDGNILYIDYISDSKRVPNYEGAYIVVNSTTGINTNSIMVPITNMKLL